MGLVSSLKEAESPLASHELMWSVMRLLDREPGMGFCGLCDSLMDVSWGKSFPLIPLLGRAMRIMAPCQLELLFEIFL